MFIRSSRWQQEVDVWLAELIATNALIQAYVDEHGSSLSTDFIHQLSNLDFLVKNSEDWAK